MTDLADILRNHPRFYDLCRQTRESAARGMRLDVGQATLLTFRMAGRLMLSFQQDGGSISFVTDELQPERVGLHGTQGMTPDVARGAIATVLASTGALESADLRLADGQGVPLW